MSPSPYREDREPCPECARRETAPKEPPKPMRIWIRNTLMSFFVTAFAMFLIAVSCMTFDTPPLAGSVIMLDIGAVVTLIVGLVSFVETKGR